MGSKIRKKIIKTKMTIIKSKIKLNNYENYKCKCDKDRRCFYCYKEKLWKLKCNRCKHEWLPRKETPPKTCPNCNSPYWNKKRIR